MNFWICVTDLDNWKIISQKEIWGVSEFYRSSIYLVEKGDKLVFYVKGGLLVGIYEAKSTASKYEDKIFRSSKYSTDAEVPFPYRIKIRPIIRSNKVINIRKLLDKLSFVKSRHRWGTYFFRAMLRINKDDYNIIKESFQR